MGKFFRKRNLEKKLRTLISCIGNFLYLEIHNDFWSNNVLVQSHMLKITGEKDRWAYEWKLIFICYIIKKNYEI